MRLIFDAVVVTNTGDQRVRVVNSAQTPKELDEIKDAFGGKKIKEFAMNIGGLDMGKQIEEVKAALDIIKPGLIKQS